MFFSDPTDRNLVNDVKSDSPHHVQVTKKTNDRLIPSNTCYRQRKTISRSDRQADEAIQNQSSNNPTVSKIVSSIFLFSPNNCPY